MAAPPDVPIELIYTVEDEFFTPEWERFAARELLHVEPIEMEGGHFPMAERPRSWRTLSTVSPPTDDVRGLDHARCPAEHGGDPGGRRDLADEWRLAFVRPSPDAPGGAWKQRLGLWKCSAHRGRKGDARSRMFHQWALNTRVRIRRAAIAASLWKSGTAHAARLEGIVPV